MSGRILVAGAFFNPEALLTALQIAITDHPEGTIVYRRGDPPGETAVQWWVDHGLPFEFHEQEKNGHLQFIQADQLVLGPPPVDLVIASITGWKTFGRCCIHAAGRGGIPVISIDD